MLAPRGRVESDSPSLAWQQRALSVEKIDLVPLTPAIAMRAASLQAARGGDPADWMIVATASELQLKPVSKDGRLRDAGIVDVIW
jgi:PIN domain nuclease of toxin-antitoxin system